MKIYIIILFVLLLTFPFSSAARVEGKIYDFSLDKVKDVLVEVNTIPSQKMLSIDGSYSFEIPSGDYILTIFEIEGNVLTKENIEIKDNGQYYIDIILPPLNQEYDTETNNTELDSAINEINEDFNFQMNKFIIISLIFLTLIGIFYFYKRTKSKSSLDKEIISQEPDALMQDVLNIIQKEKRITQKELRKHFPLSESKISLVISELESKGKIEKIKKGRGNIIIFKP